MHYLCTSGRRESLSVTNKCLSGSSAHQLYVCERLEPGWVAGHLRQLGVRRRGHCVRPGRAETHQDVLVVPDVVLQCLSGKAWEDVGRQDCRGSAVSQSGLKILSGMRHALWLTCLKINQDAHRDVNNEEADDEGIYRPQGAELHSVLSFRGLSLQP